MNTLNNTQCSVCVCCTMLIRLCHCNLVQGLHDGFDSWLSECEAKLEQPLKTEGDPQQIRMELDDLRVCILSFIVIIYHLSKYPVT